MLAASNHSVHSVNGSAAHRSAFVQLGKIDFVKNQKWNSGGPFRWPVVRSSIHTRYNLPLKIYSVTSFRSLCTISTHVHIFRSSILCHCRRRCIYLMNGIWTPLRPLTHIHSLCVRCIRPRPRPMSRPCHVTIAQQKFHHSTTDAWPSLVNGVWSLCAFALSAHHVSYNVERMAHSFVHQRQIDLCKYIYFGPDRVYECV